MALQHKNLITVLFLIFFCVEISGKLSKNNTIENAANLKTPKKVMSDGAALLFADELKMTLDKYLFGICPQTFKMPLRRNVTEPSCDLDADQNQLAGRLATLALRAHTAARLDCSRFGAALANTLGELARTAANRHAIANASNEASKKRKLSKSQKAKLQAKQRTALAVKKKAAAIAAAAAAKIST